MKKISIPRFSMRLTVFFAFIFIFIALSSFAQQNDNVYWSEDFSEGKLPDGWVIKSVGDSTVLWECTDQPFQGAHQYRKQAPPIASESRGHFMLFSPGVAVDTNINKWRHNGVYPDGFFMTGAIDCSGLKSALLKFQQKFCYNPWGHSEGAGLYAGVSNDGKNWTEYRVNKGVKGRKDSPNPMNIELNVSDVVAGQPEVYIRFYWKGFFAWYWMVDDIKLVKGFENDLAVKELISPLPEDNVFGKQDIIKAAIKNVGSESLKSDIEIYCVVDENDTLKTVFKVKENPLKSNSVREITFPPFNLYTKASHSVEVIINNPGDEDESNNTKSFTVYSKPVYLKEITATEKGADGSYIFSSYDAKVKVKFLTDDIFRIWMAPLGDFNDPAKGKIVVENDFTPVNVSYGDEGDYYKIATAKVVVRVYKSPLRFAMYDKDDKVMVWEEANSLKYGATTSQTLKRKDNEYFYGGGMQNGYFSHRDSTIKIEIGGGWDDGGRPNPAPFYMSTAGYGAFRNTFSPGEYGFHDPLTLSHDEFRFDCYYFYGESLKDILNEYTLITGRPFMPARWQLEMGDANCYNRDGFTTPVVIDSIAKKYRENDMPGGWILPNDGYGCGYTDLDSTVKGLHDLGFYTGLWTENGVDRIAWEVGTAGTRLCKLDVAWVYRGYDFALDACKTAYNGIENNSNSRGFVWSVMGWAGTQRYSTIWTGDQKGNWEYIRFHIPTVIGSGLSGFNAATGDIDGIFGGSAETYVRDLQWKCFTPVLMSMSGWAPKMKQPYIYGEPYTSINRKYLKLKMRLTPYMYTYCREAYDNGTPAVRGMLLEFPKDNVTLDNSTQYQFMLGEWLLVAPVYKDELKRDSIYFPGGTWTDYWDGTKYEGPLWLSDYNAPLDKLPLFVKEGAIIPMYPEMLYDGEKPKDPVTFDIYPKGETKFELYEDDGLTQDYRKGAFSKTLITVSGGNGKTTIEVSPANGSYNGMPEKRSYIFEVHLKNSPAKVSLSLDKTVKLKNLKTAEKYNEAGEGWFYNPEDRKGVLYIKIRSINLNNGFKLDVK